MAADRRTPVARAAVVIVAATIVGGIAMLGSPSEARRERLNESRVQDLEAVAGAVDLYWTRRGVLPASLDTMVNALGVKARMIDPGTAMPYEYRVVDSLRYELCATFDAPTTAEAPPRGDRFWSHGVGRQCFTREARQVR